MQGKVLLRRLPLPAEYNEEGKKRYYVRIKIKMQAQPLRGAAFMHPMYSWATARLTRTDSHTEHPSERLHPVSLHPGLSLECTMHPLHLPDYLQNQVLSPSMAFSPHFQPTLQLWVCETVYFCVINYYLPYE